MQYDLISSSINKLLVYCENEYFKGYDPYDTLNSFIPFNLFGKRIPVYAIQIQKRNPFNIRPLIGIKKEYNPKGLGLLLKGYSILYSLERDEKYISECERLFDLIKEHRSKNYSGACWGYNFDWASPGSYLEKYTPSAVVTAFVVDGLLEYYKVLPSDEIKELIIDTCKYILNDLPITETKAGICFAYTHKSKDCCYNASLLAAETLAKIYSLTNDATLLNYAQKAVKYVINKQKADGSWFYSIDMITGKERRQIDFHQGFILVSLHNYLKYANDNDTSIVQSIQKGLTFYRNNQFKATGASLWRLPKEYPIDIHHQAQGIITFTLLSHFDKDYLNFANTIADWTIENMLGEQGYFYYRKHRLFSDKTSYLRWGQAWMLVGLSLLYVRLNKSGQ